MAIEIIEIDFHARRVTTADDRTLPITDLFDQRGRPTLAADHAVVGVAGEPGAWITFKLAGFDRKMLQ